MASSQVLLCVLVCASLCAGSPPNIIFILADDLGYNDVSWHNPDVITPNLAALAKEGLLLENNYVQPLCTPTRSALMTGYYPIHTGRQVEALFPLSPTGLYTNFTILPEYLNQLGYRSHMAGKWHLGYCNAQYLPTSRGFLSYRGSYCGSGDYFTHLNTLVTAGDPTAGYDFILNDIPDISANGTYNTYAYTEQSVKIIEEHSSSYPADPLFLYLAYQAPHSPEQAPQKYIDLYADIEDEVRRVYLAMVTAVDESIGQVVKALRDHGLYENSIIIFSSDNGGDIFHGGSNFPLRGDKKGLFEGGTKAISFIHSALLKFNDTSFNGLMHVTDWLPTLYSAAGGDVANLGPIDGVDQWEALVNADSSASKRTEMLYNIRAIREFNSLPVGAAFRIGNFKVICGFSDFEDDIYPPDTTHSQMLEQHKPEYKDFPPYQLAKACLDREQEVALYDLEADPSESINLADSDPDLVDILLGRLAELEATMIPPDVPEHSEAGNPGNWDGFFLDGWCESVP